MRGESNRIPVVSALPDGHPNETHPEPLRSEGEQGEGPAPQLLRGSLRGFRCLSGSRAHMYCGTL